MMTTGAIAYLSLSAGVFAIWEFFMFRMLWQITRVSLDRQAETGGGYFTWVGHSLRSFFGYFREEQYKSERQRLFLLTTIMMAMIIGQAFVLPR